MSKRVNENMIVHIQVITYVYMQIFMIFGVLIIYILEFNGKKMNRIAVPLTNQVKTFVSDVNIIKCQLALVFKVTKKSKIPLLLSCYQQSMSKTFLLVQLDFMALNFPRPIRIVEEAERLQADTMPTKLKLGEAAYP